MSKPHSFRVEPWSAFPKDTYSIILDDFVHEKLLCVKINSFRPHGNVSLRNQVVSKKDNYNSSEEIKLWFPLWKDGTLYFQSTPKELKLHYDNGIIKYNQLAINWYASSQFLKKSMEPTLKVGAICLFDGFNVDNRIRVNFSKNNERRDISTGHKISFEHGKWSFHGFDIYSWNQVVSITRNAIRIGYKKDKDTSFFLRAGNNNSRLFSKFQWSNSNSYFTFFALNTNHSIDKNTTVAAQVQFTKTNIESITGLIQKKFNEGQNLMKIRAQKISKDLNVAMSYQGIIKQYGKWILGAEIQGIGSQNIFKYGLQIGLNL